jgi:hypothetical protein
LFPGNIGETCGFRITYFCCCYLIHLVGESILLHNVGQVSVLEEGAFNSGVVGLSLSL